MRGERKENKPPSQEKKQPPSLLEHRGAPEWASGHRSDEAPMAEYDTQSILPSSIPHPGQHITSADIARGRDGHGYNRGDSGRSSFDVVKAP